MQYTARDENVHAGGTFLKTVLKARPESQDHPGHGQAGQEIKRPGNRDEQASPAWSEQGQSLA